MVDLFAHWWPSIQNGAHCLQYKYPPRCTPLNSEKFMRRAVYHKVYVLKFWGSSLTKMSHGFPMGSHGNPWDTDLFTLEHHTFHGVLLYNLGIPWGSHEVPIGFPLGIDIGMVFDPMGIAWGSHGFPWDTDLFPLEHHAFPWVLL